MLQLVISLKPFPLRGVMVTFYFTTGHVRLDAILAWNNLCVKTIDLHAGGDIEKLKKSPNLF